MPTTYELEMRRLRRRVRRLRAALLVIAFGSTVGLYLLTR